MAADDAPLLAEDLAALDWDGTGLRLVASARILPFTSNAPAIWSALAHGDAPPGAEYAARPALYVVWRADFTCCFREARGAEAAQLPGLARPRLFGALCEDLARDHGPEEAIRLAGEMLARWLAEGLIVAVPQE